MAQVCNITRVYKSIRKPSRRRRRRHFRLEIRQLKSFPLSRETAVRAIKSNYVIGSAEPNYIYMI